MTSKTVTFGQIAYQAYYDASSGKSLITGEPLPRWDQVDERIQAAWNWAGMAVIDNIAQLHAQLAAAAEARDDWAARYREAMATINQLRALAVAP